MDPLEVYLHNTPPGLGIPLAQGVRRALPSDTGTGYTVEALGSESTGGLEGEAVAIATNSFTVSFGRIDSTKWQMQISGEKTPLPAISYKTAPGVRDLIRLDLPRSQNRPMRFFLNGSQVATIPIPKPFTDNPDVFLYSPDALDPTLFNYVAVRPYQKGEPELMFLPTQTRP